MPGILDALKSLLESIPPGFMPRWHDVLPGRDRVLRKLSPKEIQEHEGLCELESELRASLRKSLRYIRLFESKRFLFLDGLRTSDPRADSAEARNCLLGCRKMSDGSHVLIESVREDME